MDPQNPASLPPDNNIDTFLNEVSTPTTPAMEGGGFTSDPPPNAPPKPPYTPPDGATEPIFSQSDAAREEEEEAPTVAVKNKTLFALLKMESTISATIFALWAGEEDITPFKTSEEIIKEEVEVIPDRYKDMVMKYCPDLLPFLGIYLLDKLQTRSAALKIRRTNKSNRNGAEDTGTVSRVINLGGRSTPRSNYLLYIDGFYAKTPEGKYIKRATEKHLLERPDVKDIDKILEVKSNRKRDLLFKAFGWGNAEFNRHNITE